MARFVVDTVLETKAAEKQLADFQAKLKQFQAATTQATSQAGAGAGLAPMAKGAKQVDQALVDLQKRLVQVKTDMSMLGVEVKGKGAVRDLAQELESLRQSAVKAEAAARFEDDIPGIKAYGRLVQQATAELDKLHRAQRGASTKSGVQVDTTAQQALKAQAQAAKELDASLKQMEANRKAGRSSLEQYREELRRIREEQLKVANSAKDPTTRFQAGQRANRIGGMINEADSKEAERLARGLEKIKVRLAEGKISAEAAARAYAQLSARSRELSTSQDMSAGTARKFIAMQQQAAEAAKKATGANAELRDAMQQQAQIQQLSTRYRAGLFDGNQKAQAAAYRAELERILGTSRQFARDTRIGTQAQQQYAKAAEEAAKALHRLRSEQLNGPNGGSAAFALNSVGFAASGVGAAGVAFVADALQLSEEAKMAGANLEASAKYYGQSIEQTGDVIKRLEAEVRLDAGSIQKAMSDLYRKGFSAEAAETMIRRFADSAAAKGSSDVRGAVLRGSEAILTEQSRMLNSAFISENLGPFHTEMRRAAKQGEDYFRNVFLNTKEAVEEFDRLRNSGKSFTEAMQPAADLQFIIKATASEAGRMAEINGTLTGSLQALSTEWVKLKINMVEGVGKAAAPAVNMAANLMAAFNQLPPVVKSTVGVTAALATLGTVALGTIALFSSFVLQLQKVTFFQNAYAIATGKASISNATWRAVMVALNADLTRNTVLQAANTVQMRLMSAQTNVASAATAWFAREQAALTAATAGSTGALGAFNTVMRTSAVSLGVAAAAIGAVAFAFGYFANTIAKDTIQAYDDIAEASESAREKLVATRGEDFAGGLENLVTLQQVKGDIEKALAEADTPEDKAKQEQRLKRVNELIAAQENELRSLNELNQQKKGDAVATQEQADAYNNLRLSMEGTMAQFSEDGMTDFQKGLKQVEKAAQAAEKEIDKLAMVDPNTGLRGITEEQEKSLREGLANMVPDATAGLVAREMKEAQAAARQVRMDMEREQAEMMKDGIEKRKALLDIEKRETVESYKDRIREVRQNLKDPNLQPNVNLPKEENERRAALLRQYANLEQQLIEERDDKVLLLEKQATEDIVKLRQERADKILDIARAQAEAEVSLLNARIDALEGGRDAALAGQDEAGRLRVEQAYQGRVLAMTQDRIRREAAIREGELKQQFDREVREAVELGEDKAKAEAAAQAKYDASLAASRLSTETEVANARREANERVAEANAALIESNIDRELKGIEKVSGAQIAALQRRYRTELAAARAKGDGAAADAYQQGLDTLSGEAEKRLDNARELAEKAKESAASLNEQLAELSGTAAKGLAGAHRAAAKPFDDFVKERKKEIDELNKARAALVYPSQDVLNAIDSRIAELGGMTRQAAAARTVAVNRAEQEYQNARLKSMRDLTDAQLEYASETAAADQQVTAALRDRLSLTQQLIADQGRLIEQAKANGEDEATINGLRAERYRLLGQEASISRQIDERPIQIAEEQLRLTQAQAKARLALSRDRGNEVKQAQLAVDLAQQELGLARQKQAAAKTEADRRAADTEVAEKQVALVDAQRGVLDAQMTARERQLRYTQALAREQLALNGLADDGVAQARLGVELAQKEVELARAKVQSAQSEAEYQTARTDLADKTVAQAQAEKALLTAQRQEQEAVSDLARKELETALELSKNEGERTRLRGELLAFDRNRLAALDTEIASLSASGADEARLRDLKGERLDLQRQINSAIRDEKARTRELLEATRARQRAELELAGKLAASDAQLMQVRAANLALLRQEAWDIIQQLRQETDLLKQEALRAQLAGKLGEITDAERQARTVPTSDTPGAPSVSLDTAQRELSLSQARRTVQAEISRLSSDTVASAELELDFARENLALTQRRLRTGNLSLEERNDLMQQWQDQALALAKAENALADAENERLKMLRELRKGHEELNRSLGSQEYNPLGIAERERLQTLGALREAEANYQQVLDDGNWDSAVNATQELTKASEAYRASLIKVVDAYRAQIQGMKGVQDAAWALADAVRASKGEGVRPEDAKMELKRLDFIEKRRAQAAKALNQAMTPDYEALQKAAQKHAEAAQAGDEKAARDALDEMERVRIGDPSKIKEAMESLTQLQNQFNQQQEKLVKSGVRVPAELTNKIQETGKAIEALADRAGQLSDSYGFELDQLDPEMQAADIKSKAALTELEAAHTFADAVARLEKATEEKGKLIQEAGRGGTSEEGSSAGGGGFGGGGKFFGDRVAAAGDRLETGGQNAAAALEGAGQAVAEALAPTLGTPARFADGQMLSPIERVFGPGGKLIWQAPAPAPKPVPVTFPAPQDIQRALTSQIVQPLTSAVAAIPAQVAREAAQAKAVGGTYTTTVNLGGVNVTAAPNQDARQLAQAVISEIRTQAEQNTAWHTPPCREDT